MNQTQKELLIKEGIYQLKLLNTSLKYETEILKVETTFKEITEKEILYKSLYFTDYILKRIDLILSIFEGLK